MSDSNDAGMNAGTPGPSTLWFQAVDEHPNDGGARRERYIELMREHGHIVDADDPDAGPKNLPCGWPGNTESPAEGASDG